jgi:flagellar biosynthesis GTPase FlhF
MEMTPKTIAVAVIAAIIFTAGYWLGAKIETTARIRLEAQWADERAAQHKKQEQALAAYAETIQQARKSETAWRDAAQQAEINNAIAERHRQNERAAADRTAGQLRQQLAAARRSLSQSACPPAAALGAALADIYEQCTKEYVDVAENADRCAAELTRTRDQWPRPP